MKQRKVVVTMEMLSKDKLTDLKKATWWMGKLTKGGIEGTALLQVQVNVVKDEK